MMKAPLLFLCHRIPFPPNKGDKITTFNILKFLSQHYEIHLGCFIDDTFDTQYEQQVAHFCTRSIFIPISLTYSKLKGLTSLLNGNPITLPFYHRQSMQQWVDSTIHRYHIDKAFVYSGCMAQYVINPPRKLHTVMHFADIDSDKWRQYADKTHGIMKFIYSREYKKLSEYEKTVADLLSISCFVTETETNAFKAMLPLSLQDKIHPLENGLNYSYFSPDAHFMLNEAYSLASENYIVFSGAMDYWANEDAVLWFSEHVWPAIHRSQPDAKLYLVGSSPSSTVQALSLYPGITVTGRVKDIRPYLHYAKAAIAPMQIARGVQNKMLEAMAMATPIIVSSLTIEGMDPCPSENLIVSDEPSDIADWLIDKLIQQPIKAIELRQWIEQHFCWEAKLNPLLAYLEPSDVDTQRIDNGTI
ncbi:TIGR03087 family PEP-CTERM/XrtA system glycosyltransferase [Photobacterium nomapromontoriensis]|uniref:TIGR03087 family PEP-CTERM/XrtA system glycosyltransferase n=1 Tax=Photobacterium nomapromontoriensis TaxID=2910237 RepID=UPI003D0B3C64